MDGVEALLEAMNCAMAAELSARYAAILAASRSSASKNSGSSGSLLGRQLLAARLIYGSLLEQRSPTALTRSEENSAVLQSGVGCRLVEEFPQ